MRNVVKFTDYKQYHTSSRIIYNGQDITDNKVPDDKNNKSPNNQDKNKQQSAPPPPQSPH
jgi:hypothetical protein